MRHSLAHSTPAALLITFIALTCGARANGAEVQDFGPNVTIIDPAMSVDAINSTLQSLATQSTGFDEVRNAVYFLPGTYGSAAGADNPATATGYINSPVGFMETVQGLGASPDDVTINGNLRAGQATGFSLNTFWRSLANLRINPIEADEPMPHTLRWNTSQAAPVRRVDIVGNLDLSGGSAGGNIIANSRISGAVIAGFRWVTDSTRLGGQFYYYIHDSQIGGFQGHFANYVFSGVQGAPAASFNPGDVTNLRTTPVSREAPYLYVDHKAFRVMVPEARTNVAGYHWGARSSLSLDEFFIAKPTDTAQAINDALAHGKNLILTPGVYKVTDAIHIIRANTIVLGMGLASVTPVNGTPAVVVDDVPGVSISGITVDANTVNSAVLVQVGSPNRQVRKRDSRAGIISTTLSDVFVRVGGSYAASHATTSFEINQDNVLIDHTWLWRADHGARGTTGWTVNTGDHGLVVNGNHVTALGLFVEHYQKTQILWNGEAGQTIFLQSEAPYDPPNQAAFMNGTENGYPFYEVANGVGSHDASGITAMTLFMAKTPIFIHSAFKAPMTQNVRFHNMLAGVLLGTGGIENVINDFGGHAEVGDPSFLANVAATTQLTAYP
jgi:hypothetical protein